MSGPPPGCDPQTAPVLAPRGCSKAFYHFQLEHKVHVLNDGTIVQQLKNEGGGDVVRQVAYHAQLLTLSAWLCWCAADQARKIKVERIGAVQREAGLEAERR